MVYQVLARKWRPRLFSEVVGQDHILRILQNAFVQNRLHHAYLFVGTRGVGKTTLGRILAKCFNCEVGVSAVPCCQCETCLSIDACRFVDLIEIDAASRTKVEDIRDLLHNVQYAPTIGRYKVYLIDEVHMLSLHSFNALLKTLEEPPPHVKFLLATTDPQRLPVTILSRCLQFNLKNIASEKIELHLMKILDAEGISSEKAALRQLAKAAQGSMRDALSLLDQAIAYGAGKVQDVDVMEMLGTIEQGKLFALLEALVACDTAKTFAIISEFAELAIDFFNVLDELLDLLHRIAILQRIPDLDESSWDDVTLLKSFAKRIAPEDVQLYYQIGLIGKRDLELAPSLRSGFEMVMLRMLHFRLETFIGTGEDKSSDGSSLDDAEIDNETTSLKGQNSELNSSPISQVKSATDLESKVKSEFTEEFVSSAELPARSLPISSAAKKVNFSDRNVLPVTTEEWLGILMELKLSGTTLALIRHCSIGSFDQKTRELQLLLEPAQAPFLNIKHEERISQALYDLLQQTIHVIITVGNASGGNTLASIIKRDAEIERRTKEQDPQIKALIDAFDAKIIN